jgi:hypothetical protein
MTARMPLIAIMVATLGGCDSYARMSPDFLKYNAPPERELEAAPDARQIVRDNVAAIFIAQSAPKNIAVSPAERRGGHWQSCVRASVTGMTGKQVGVQTFAITFERGKIISRDRTDASHWCATQSYEPV